MTPVQSIIRQTRRPLLMLAAAGLVALAIALGSGYLRGHQREGINQGSAQVSALQAELAQKELDLGNIQEHIEKFHALKQQGLVGNADREGWVEQFVTSHRALGLGGTRLTYSLEPPKAVGATTTADNPVAVDPAAPLQHDLLFELQDVHEVELLKLLQDYKTKIVGQFRVESCELGTPAPTGLLAKCVLRFFNLPDAPEASAT